MPIAKTERLQIQSASDVVLVRQMVRQLAVELGFSLVEQTKVVTAASELARNTLDYGGGGLVHLQTLQEDRRRGLLLCFEDQGPGIADVDLALQDGYTTGNGLGLGLGGAKRLVNEFKISSQPGLGTSVTVIKWKGLRRVQWFKMWPCRSRKPVRQGRPDGPQSRWPLVWGLTRPGRER